jgi:hypothetical protein
MRATLDAIVGLLFSCKRKLLKSPLKHDQHSVLGEKKARLAEGMSLFARMT